MFHSNFKHSCLKYASILLSKKFEKLLQCKSFSHFFNKNISEFGYQVVNTLRVDFLTSCPTIWMIVGQGPIALAVGAGGFFLDIFILVYPFSPLSPSLWETARYTLKYCLKGPLNPKQPTKILTSSLS